MQEYPTASHCHMVHKFHCIQAAWGYSYLLREGEQLLPVGWGVVQAPIEHSHVGGQS